MAISDDRSTERHPPGKRGERGAPAISVCIPTWNYGRFLPDAIESVLNQSIDGFELLIVDNASTDDTAEIVRRYMKRDPRIKYRINAVHVGMVDNFNLCLRAASGEYVKLLCADDLLEPTCIEKLLGALESHPKASLAASARLLVDERLAPLKVLAYSDDFAEENGFEVIRRCLLDGNLIGEPSSVMFRKIQSQRGFSARYRQLVDLEMWFHLLEQGDFVFIPEPLSRFRLHGEQRTWEHVRNPGFFDDAWRLFREFIDKDYIRISPARKSFLKTVRRGGMELLRRSSFARSAFSFLRSKTASRHHV